MTRNINPPQTPDKQPLTQEMDMQALLVKAKELAPEEVREKVNFLNRRVKLTGVSHEVEVSVDPSIHTWACCRVPKKTVQSNGEIVETNYFHYIIVMPYEHLAIDDTNFLLGELRHELGHALYTDWRMNDRLNKLAESAGYPKDAMGSLTNCLEDPRMEHVSTLPPQSNGYVRNWFWAKNKTFILPNIGNGIGKMHPVKQFDFLIKLYSLWQIHKKNADDENIEMWDGIASLEPRVQEIWEEIKSELDKVVGVGTANKPEFRSYAIEESIRKVFWPAKTQLIDEFGTPPADDSKGEGEGGGGGDEGGKPGDPDDIDNLPPDVKKLINQQIEKYKQGIEKQQQQQIEHNKKAEEENKKIEQKQHERNKKKDGIESAEIRKKYNRLKRQANIIQRRMGRLFEKYFPKVAFPRDTYNTRGKRYAIREHLKRYGTGLEKPMGTPNTPEKSGFILQLIVDVSGSMNGSRIEEVIKIVIGILEASKDYPIHIEILASDDKHGGIDDSYILKAFNEDFGGAAGGRIKERLVGALTNFGGDSKDAESLSWAIPRILKKKRSLMSEYEKIAALTIFLSDAENEGQQDPNVVNELRKKIPILGGCIENDPSIKDAVQTAYGPEGEGSFCPSSLADFPVIFEKILRRKIRKLFR